MNIRKLLSGFFHTCRATTGNNQYFRVELGPVDGIRRHHARIMGRCGGCGSPVIIGRFHTHSDGHLYGSKERFDYKINLKHMKSDYKYQIDSPILFIEDLNLGGKSVTNDIENVLKSISKELGTSISNYHVIYRDSEGNIDGVHTKNGEFLDFYHIGTTDYYKAKLMVKPNP